MRDIICEAIHARRRARVLYRGHERIVEPYVLSETAPGSLVLHGWQIAGHSESNADGHWVNLARADISEFAPRTDRFREPHEGYNPASSKFHRIICAVSPTLTVVGKRRPRR
jgi:hypothetical protein